MNLSTVLRIAVLLALGVIFYVKATTPAPAHSWYPKRCCGDGDCYRVTAIEQTPLGRRMSLDNGSQVLVPPAQKFEPSVDGDYHLCVGYGDYDIGILCAFEPAGS